ALANAHLADVRALANAHLADVRALANAHLADVRAKMANLEAMGRVLAETVARCAAGRGAHYPLIDAFYRDGLAPARESAAAPARRRASNRRWPQAIRIPRSRRSR
ncbi:MAG: hypothetical protein ACREKS_20150, partial [Candidatus Rokuibacteriota bacterium]